MLLLHLVSVNAMIEVTSCAPAELSLSPQVPDNITPPSASYFRAVRLPPSQRQDST